MMLFRHGEVDPLTLEIKFDKKGLPSAEEGIMKRRKGDALTLTGTCNCFKPFGHTDF